MVISGAVTSVFLIFISLFFEQQLIPRTITSIISLFLLAFVSQFLGQALITYSLAYLPASTSSLTLLIQPITATFLGYLFFQEKLNSIQFLGCILILIGIYIARAKNK